MVVVPRAYKVKPLTRDSCSFRFLTIPTATPLNPLTPFIERDIPSQPATQTPKMCFECLVSVDSHSSSEYLVRVDSHNEAQGRNLDAITKDEAMEFAPVGTYPSTGIDVLVVGTGFGGLTAALEFTRKGHNVRILERNSEPDISGKSASPSASPTKATQYLATLRH